MSPEMTALAIFLPKAALILWVALSVRSIRLEREAREAERAASAETIADETPALKRAA